MILLGVDIDSNAIIGVDSVQLLGDVESALDEIIAFQESLINDGNS